MVKDPTTPKTRHYTTLLSIDFQKLNITNSAANHNPNYGGRVVYVIEQTN